MELNLYSIIYLHNRALYHLDNFTLHQRQLHKEFQLIKTPTACSNVIYTLSMDSVLVMSEIVYLKNGRPRCRNLTSHADFRNNRSELQIKNNLPFNSSVMPKKKETLKLTIFDGSCVIHMQCNCHTLCMCCKVYLIL